MTTAVRDSVLVTNQDREKAASFVRDLDVASGASSTLPVPAPEVLRLIRKILRSVAAGRTVTVGTLPEELTTSVAAEMLHISRPTLMKLIREGKIPSHKVGTHTRVRTVDVQHFGRQQVERQRIAFEELRDLEDALGLD